MEKVTKCLIASIAFVFGSVAVTVLHLGSVARDSLVTDAAVKAYRAAYDEGYKAGMTDTVAMLAAFEEIRNAPFESFEPPMKFAPDLFINPIR